MQSLWSEIVFIDSMKTDRDVILKVDDGCFNTWYPFLMSPPNPAVELWVWSNNSSLTVSLDSTVFWGENSSSLLTAMLWEPSAICAKMRECKDFRERQNPTVYLVSLKRELNRADRMMSYWHVLISMCKQFNWILRTNAISSKNLLKLLCGRSYVKLSQETWFRSEKSRKTGENINWETKEAQELRVNERLIF